MMIIFVLVKWKKSDFVKNDKLIMYVDYYDMLKLKKKSNNNEYRERLYITGKLLKEKNIITPFSVKFGTFL